MGHWNATTLGNDTALDCLGGYIGLEKSAAICDRLRADLAPPEHGDVFDEGEAPHVAAACELVAAALGRTGPTLATEGVDAWLERNGELAAAFRDEAIAAVEVLGRSPYATMWVRPEGNAEFAASLADLGARLRLGRARKMKPVKTRFLEHVAHLLAADGWKLRKKDATLTRPIEGGAHRVRFVLLGKWGLWTALIRFEVAVYEAQRVAYEALGRTDEPKDGCVHMGQVPRRFYDRSGNVSRLELYRPGVDPPPAAALAEVGLKPVDLLNPEETVRRAAERAAAIVRQLGGRWFAGYDGPEAFREDLATMDPATIEPRVLTKGRSGHAFYAWLALAWKLDPSRAAALLDVRRHALDGVDGVAADRARAEYDAVEAALRGLYG